jgi:hypothetical protein
MITTSPGLIAQTSGFSTKKRYTCATIFVDNATGFTFVHFQKSTNADETVDAKSHFERTCREMGVSIRHYHADNGIFTAKLWRNHCIVNNQGLTFAGVGAHHQNGVAENKIRQLQDQAQTMLIHANQRWNGKVTASLWPYAVRMAALSMNDLPSLQLKNATTPLQAFSRTTVYTNPKHWHHFGCPVYVLNAGLQSAGGIQNKWTDRSRVGVYLGRSPEHARSVALFLSLQTGHVSPQFHVSFDPSFQTVKKSFAGQSLTSKWQYKTGFDKSSTDKPVLPSTSTTAQATSNVQYTYKPVQLPQAPIEPVVRDDTPSHACGFMRHRRIDPKVSVGCKGCLQLIAILDCEHRL